jgi:hypothetical protein
MHDESISVNSAAVPVASEPYLWLVKLFRIMKDVAAFVAIADVPLAVKFAVSGRFL